MTQSYLLDTNAYALFFQNPKTPPYLRLESKIKSGTEINFYIPEIVSMEIHSVLGKYRRGGNQEQNEKCEKTIVADPTPIKCSHTCFYAARIRIKPKIFRDIQKLLNDIENQRGTIKAKVLPLSSDDMIEAKALLSTYADKYSFGSHDALVAGAMIKNQSTLNLTLVTSDKGLKAVSMAKGIKVFDPAIE